MSASNKIIAVRKYLDGKEALRRLINGEILIMDTGRRVYFNDNYFLSDGTIYEIRKEEIFTGPFNNFMNMRREENEILL